MRIEIDNMRNGYTKVINEVRTRGRLVSPRGIPTTEVLGAQVVLSDIGDALPVGINRKVSMSFAAVEAAQLVAGVSMVELTTRINPTMHRFVDEGVNGPYFHGAYGPRIRDSLRYIVGKLDEDRDSRQALVNIWTQDKDLNVARADVPCTVVLHFMIRKNRLILHTTMRSNDVWWGLAYDVFQFTQLQWTVARALDVEPGLYYHNANSLHAYARDFDAMDALAPASGKVFEHPLGFGHSSAQSDVFPETVIMEYQDRAYDILRGESTFINATPSERWYLGQLHDR